MQSGKRCWIGLIIAIGAMAIVLSSVWSPPLAATQYPREKRRKPTPRTKRQPRTTPVPRRQPPPTTERQPRPNESQQQPPKTSVSPQTVTIELVDIPAGEFTMGSENGNTNEKPVHRVRINYAFKMGKYEVTQAQWQEVMGSNPSYFKFCGGNCPLENVSWNDVQQFLQRLNARKDLYTYRLPTEAEWEYACRAGTTTEFAFGKP